MERGFRLVARDETGSTNDDAVAALAGGDTGRLWITARSQASGRGRHGRSWASPPGNLYASLLLVEPCEQRHAAQFGYLIGLALHDAFCAIAPGYAGRVRLKWPNDVLVDRAKIAGLLLEGHHTRGGRFALIAGIGVNIAFTPADTPYPAAKLADLRADADPEGLFEALSRAFALRFEAWNETTDDQVALGALREEWLSRAYGLDAEVTIRPPSGERRGRFVGLDGEGRLLLATEWGVETIDAGDLFFAGA
ncbi:MAG: biotin--[acetyl-CoA-carboxylase] ligase [Salinarimonadaceae bacterium]|nr:MAG: biotin--[acetyl-CoA-carboxylase] ligase [Salinarimonadaceae bacterium]